MRNGAGEAEIGRENGLVHFATLPLRKHMKALCISKLLRARRTSASCREKLRKAKLSSYIFAAAIWKAEVQAELRHI